MKTNLTDQKMLFEYRLRKILSLWAPDFDGRAVLLEKLSIIQQFYQEQRDELILLIIDTLEADGGMRLPVLLTVMDEEVNGWFKLERDFTFSEVLLDNLI